MAQKKQQSDIAEQRGFHSLDRRPRSRGDGGQLGKAPKSSAPPKVKKTKEKLPKQIGKKTKPESPAKKKKVKPQRHLTRAEKSRRDILYDTKSFDIVVPESEERESKKKKRKRVHPIAIVVVSLAVLFVAALAGVFLIFKVDTIDVTGESIYTKEEILEATGFEIGDNLFFLPIEDVEKSIPVTLPYIEDISITRELPHKVILSISAVTPGGVLQYGSQFVLIDGNCKIIDIKDEQLAGFMEIRGVEIEEPKIGEEVKVIDAAKNDSLYSIIKQLAASGSLAETSSLSLNDLSKIELIYQNRVKIRVGSVSDLSYKVKYGMDIVTDPVKINSDAHGILDVTLSAGKRTAYYKAEQNLNAVQQKPAEGTDDQNPEAEIQTAVFAENIGRGSDIPDKPYTGSLSSSEEDETVQDDGESYDEDINYDEDYDSDEYIDEA